MKSTRAAIVDLVLDSLGSSDGLDFTAALSDSWPVEMDAALVQYASERAAMCAIRAYQLKPEDIFDKKKNGAHKQTQAWLKLGNDSVVRMANRHRTGRHCGAVFPSPRALVHKNMALHVLRVLLAQHQCI